MSPETHNDEPMEPAEPISKMKRTLARWKLVMKLNWIESNRINSRHSELIYFARRHKA